MSNWKESQTKKIAVYETAETKTIFLTGVNSFILSGVLTDSLTKYSTGT